MRTLSRKTLHCDASASGASSLKERLQLRDEFFRHTLEPRQLLQPLAHIPGVLMYFVKDAESRLMAISPESVKRMGLQSEEEILGKKPHEFLPADLANKYLADDQWVVRHGKPLLNIVEVWFNEQRIRDWSVTNKYPLRNAGGQVVGLVGTVQSFEARRQLLAHLGPVGQAADFIREHLGERMLLAEIARHAGFSERQLQRLFRRVFGMTIQQFIIRSRIHAAIHELTHSERSIAEIAISLGFSDQSAFSNRFREATGTPPRSYRDRHVARFTP
jgi:AraC-like DNA-binding protein